MASERQETHHSNGAQGAGPGSSGAAQGSEADELSELLTVEEAARFLRLKRSTLDHYRCEGRGPVYRKHGGRVFYTRRSLQAWSNRHTYQSTSKRIGP